jgi:Ribosome-associated heat shock protein implicated in the recycling of the 50S subunit (S4 paralog)
MRLDKYLKVARVIKRRTIANEVSAAGRVSVNGKTAKPSTDIKPGDIIEIAFDSGLSRIRVLAVKETVRKNEASELFEILEAGDALKE